MSKASGSIDLKSLKIAGEGASKYITEITSDGIFISPSSQNPADSAEGDSVKINGNGMEIYKGGVSVAQFGDTARVGKDIGRHVLIDEDSVDIKDGANVKATFGETVTIGDANAYHTSITETDFGIYSGNDSMFNVSATGEQKSIIAKAFDLPAYINYQSSTRNTSGSMKAGVTYTFYLYKTTGQVGTYTFNTDDVTWSSSPISRSFGYLNNTVTIVVWKPVNGSAHYMARQETSVDPRTMYRFYAEYPTTIDVPTMEFQGSVTIGGHNSSIGTLLETSASGVSIASGADSWRYLTGCQLTLTEGSWIITYSAYCSTLASGKRLAGALKNTANENIWYGSRSIMHTSNTAPGAISGVFPCVVTESSITVRLMVFQTQGSAQDMSGYIRAMRIA